jgi:hypothetical protein
MNSVCDAVLVRSRRSIEDLRAVVVGMPAEGLNWKPGDDTNSIASQVAHVLKSAEFLLTSAATPTSDLKAYLRIRADTFHFGADANALLEMLDEFDATLPGRLKSVDEASFSRVIPWEDWPPQTVAWCLMGIVEHLREHVGAAALTKQLWEQKRESR